MLENNEPSQRPSNPDLLESLLAHLQPQTLLSQILATHPEDPTFFSANHANFIRLFSEPVVFMSQSLLESQLFHDFLRVVLLRLFDSSEVDRRPKLVFLTAFLRLKLKNKLSSKIQIDLVFLEKSREFMFRVTPKDVGLKQLRFQAGRFLRSLQKGLRVDLPVVQEIARQPLKVRLALISYLIDLKSASPEVCFAVQQALQAFSLSTLESSRPQLFGLLLASGKFVFEFEEIFQVLSRRLSRPDIRKDPVKDSEASQRSKTPAFLAAASVLFGPHLTASQRDRVWGLLERKFTVSKSVLARSGPHLTAGLWHDLVTFLVKFLKQLGRFVKAGGAFHPALQEAVRVHVLGVISHMPFAGKTDDYRFKRCLYQAHQVYGDALGDTVLSSVRGFLHSQRLKVSILVNLMGKRDFSFDLVLPPDLTQQFEQRTESLLASENKEITQPLAEYLLTRLGELANASFSQHKTQIVQKLHLLVDSKVLLEVLVDFRQLDPAAFPLSPAEVQEILAKVDQTLTPVLQKADPTSPKARLKSLSRFLDFLWQICPQAVVPHLESLLQTAATKCQESSELGLRNPSVIRALESFLVLYRNIPKSIRIHLPKNLLLRVLEGLESLSQLANPQNGAFLMDIAKQLCQDLEACEPTLVSTRIREHLAKTALLSEANFDSEFDTTFFRSYVLAALFLFNSHGVATAPTSRELVGVFRRVTEEAMTLMEKKGVYSSGFSWALSQTIAPLANLETAEVKSNSEVFQFLESGKVFDQEFRLHQNETFRLGLLLRRKLRELRGGHKQATVRFLEENHDFITRVFFLNWTKYDSLSTAYPKALALATDVHGKQDQIHEFFRQFGSIDDAQFFEKANQTASILRTFQQLLETKTPTQDFDILLLRRVLDLIQTEKDFETKMQITGFLLFNLFSRHPRFAGRSRDLQLLVAHGAGDTKLQQTVKQLIRLIFFPDFTQEVAAETDFAKLRKEPLMNDMGLIRLALYLKFTKKTFETQNLVELPANQPEVSGRIQMDSSLSRDLVIQPRLPKLRPKLWTFKAAPSLGFPREFFEHLVTMIGEEIRLEKLGEMPSMLKALAGQSQTGPFLSVLQSSNSLRLLREVLVLSDESSLDHFINWHLKKVSAEADQTALRTVLFWTIFSALNKGPRPQSSKLFTLFWKELDSIAANLRVNIIDLLKKLAKSHLPLDAIHLPLFLATVRRLVDKSTPNSVFFAVFLAALGSLFVMDSGARQSVLGRLRQLTSLSVNQQYFASTCLESLLENYHQLQALENGAGPNKDSFVGEFLELLLAKIDLTASNIETFGGSLKLLSRLPPSDPSAQNLRSRIFEKLLAFLELAKEKEGKDWLLTRFEHGFGFNTSLESSLSAFPSRLTQLVQAEAKHAEAALALTMVQNCLYFGDVTSLVRVAVTVHQTGSFFGVQRIEAALKALLRELSHPQILNYLSQTAQFTPVPLKAWLLHLALPSLHGNLWALNPFFTEVARVLADLPSGPDREKLEKSLAEFSYLANDFPNLEGVPLEAALVHSLVKNIATVSYLS